MGIFDTGMLFLVAFIAFWFSLGLVSVVLSAFQAKKEHRKKMILKGL